MPFAFIKIWNAGLGSGAKKQTFPKFGKIEG